MIPGIKTLATELLPGLRNAAVCAVGAVVLFKLFYFSLTYILNVSPVRATGSAFAAMWIVTVVALFIANLKVRLNRTSVILDCGRFRFAPFMIAFAAMIMATGFMQVTQHPSIGIFNIFASILIASTALQRTQIREAGIANIENFIAWDNI